VKELHPFPWPPSRAAAWACSGAAAVATMGPEAAVVIGMAYVVAGLGTEDVDLGDDGPHPMPHCSLLSMRHHLHTDKAGPVPPPSSASGASSKNDVERSRS
jgi:hypothetical protein